MSEGLGASGSFRAFQICFDRLKTRNRSKVMPFLVRARLRGGRFHLIIRLLRYQSGVIPGRLSSGTPPRAAARQLACSHRAPADVAAAATARCARPSRSAGASRTCRPLVSSRSTAPRTTAAAGGGARSADGDAASPCGLMLWQSIHLARAADPTLCQHCERCMCRSVAARG